MNLAFSGASGVFLRRMVAGMELFRDRCMPPREFFWGLENALPFRNVIFDATLPPPRTSPPTWTRERIFRLLNMFLKGDNLAGLAAELDGIDTRQRTAAAKFWLARRSLAIKTVYERLVPALREIVPKFEANGETPESLFGVIPGKTIAAVLNAYAKKKRKPGPPPFREMAVAILLKLERSDEDPAARLSNLDAARKEKRRPRRKPRRAKSATHSR